MIHCTYNLTAKQLSRAAALQGKIEHLRGELTKLLSGDGVVRPDVGGGGRHRVRGKLSASGRARIVAAQKARWARFRAEKG